MYIFLYSYNIILWLWFIFRNFIFPFSVILTFMLYKKIVQGVFVDRPNRFIAHVEIEGKIETVHVKNTGRCKELLLPGCKVILEDFRGRPEGLNRKTQFDLLSVYKVLAPQHPLYDSTGSLLINMDSQAPNKMVLEWLNSLPADEAYDFVKPEYTFGNSRVDFYMEKGAQKFLMEVKGCTLERDGTGYFPDAPTERGVKHLHELTEAVEKGYKCILAFVIQIPGVKMVYPNVETHPEFGVALSAAQKAGVEILYLQSQVTEREVRIIGN